ncbi:unnamed protein product [Moneuplotes crassus]|uniref:Uncharacterized protein n=1 Tax=Euplotes crassus TaxID=5936 RepID=A0AAD1X553_EUPCR|nr:unnamed protein product [Moneuplotes crassus]
MEDTIGETRRKDFMRIPPKNIVRERESYMISLRKKRRAKIYKEKRQMMPAKHQTHKEREFIKDNKVFDNVEGFEATFEHLKEFKAGNCRDLENIHLYLTLLSEYTIDFVEEKKDFAELFQNINYHEMFDYCTEVIDKIDRQEHQNRFHDILDRILDIFIILCEENDDFLDKLFYCDEFVPITSQIYKWLSKFWNEKFPQKLQENKSEENKCEENKSHETLLNKARRSLSKLQVLYIYFSISQDRAEILLKDGNYLETISNLFVYNKSLKCKKIWYYSCVSAINLCSTTKTAIDKYKDILESIAIDLKGDNISIINTDSLNVILSILNQYNKEAELKKAVDFVGSKVSNLMDICINFYSELTQISEKFEGPKTDGICEELIHITSDIMSIFIEYDKNSYIEEIISEEVFEGILKALNKCKTKGKVFSFLACFTETYSWELSREHNSSTFQTQQKQDPIKLIVISGIIQDNYNLIFKSSSESEKTQFIRFLTKIVAHTNEYGTIDRELINTGIFNSCIETENSDQHFCRSDDFIPCIFQHIIHITEEDCISKLLFSSLELLYTLLHFGERRTNENYQNTLALNFQEKGGIDALENLQTYCNKSIFTACVKIIDDFYNLK